MLTIQQARKQVQDDYNSGLRERALQLSNEIIKLMPHDPVALTYLGRIAKETGDVNRAWNSFRLLALTFPHNQGYLDEALSVVPNAEYRKTFLSDREKLASGVSGFHNKPALQLVDNPVGKMVVPMFPDTDVIAKSIKSGQIFEQYIVDIARSYITPGTSVIDVGANFGQMTLIFSRMCGENGTVYSVEADDYVHHVLNTNLTLNNIKNCVPIHAAAHKINDSIVYFPDQDFEMFGTYGSYGIDPQTRNGREVRTFTIDSLAITNPISFMKIDVQGADLWVLQGAKETILRHKMPIIFEYEEQFQSRFETSFNDYVDFVKEINYRFVKTVNQINFLIAPN